MITALRHLSASPERAPTQRVFCIQDNGATGPLGYSDGNAAVMLLAGTLQQHGAGLVRAVLMTCQPPKTKWWGSAIIFSAALQFRELIRHSLIHSEAWSSAYWGTLIPEEGQSLCRVICLAVPFCPCYCGYCVFPSEEHTEAPHFRKLTLHFCYASFFWHLVSSPVHRLRPVRWAQELCPCTLAAQCGSPAQCMTWLLCVCPKFGFYSRCLCLY